MANTVPSSKNSYGKNWIPDDLSAKSQQAQKQRSKYAIIFDEMEIQAAKNMLQRVKIVVLISAKCLVETLDSQDNMPVSVNSPEILQEAEKIFTWKCQYSRVSRH